jgi:hypothetical protein
MIGVYAVGRHGSMADYHIASMALAQTSAWLFGRLSRQERTPVFKKWPSLL